MKINFDPKTWLILVVSAIAISLLFFYFYDSSGHKRLIKNLEQRAGELEEKREQLKQEVEFYKLLKQFFESFVGSSSYLKK